MENIRSQTQAPWDLRGKSVVLINPLWKIQSESVWAEVASCYPSIGLALIAASLEKYGAAVRIIDLQAEPYAYEGIATVTPPDFVGITAWWHLRHTAPTSPSRNFP